MVSPGKVNSLLLIPETSASAFDSGDERVFVTAEEVAAPAAPCKKDVAGKQERWRFLAVHITGGFAVESESAGGVPCHMDDLQLDSRDFDGIAFGEVVP